MPQETTSLWSNDVKLYSYPAVDSNLQCDVCVVGAGIAGITTAYLLGKSGKRVIVVDDGPVAGGQSQRTTGHLSFILRERFFDLENYFGTQKAKIAVESHRAAIDFINSVISEHKIDCDFSMQKAYLFLSPNQNSEIIEKELQAVKRLGLPGKKVPRAPLEGVDTGLAICFSDHAQFHPLKYINSLSDIIESQGNKIYCNTHINSIKREKNYILSTNNNHFIEASHVVIATNSPINNRFFPHLKQAAYRTYVIAGKIPEKDVPLGLFYDTLDPYHYFRTHRNRQGEEILIVGGEDHRTAEERNIEQRYRELEYWTEQRFPRFKLINRWSGQVTESIDGLGFIGRAKNNQELYIITGDSGNGLTHGTIGALLINDLIDGKASPWQELYNPHRKTLKAAKAFIAENVNTLFQYRDWLTKGQSEVLANNSGAIVRRGLKKCAQYKDEKGTIHELSAICPHLGAIIRWNPEEHCWECPAHGSRFDALGRVVQGPANKDLKKL